MCRDSFVRSCPVYYQEMPQADGMWTFAEWLAHENAVFDIAWVPGEPQLVSMNFVLFSVFVFLSAHIKLFTRPPQVTAAGDQMARLWDVKSGDMLGSFKGHLCSLKSVAFAPQEKGTFEQTCHLVDKCSLSSLRIHGTTWI